MTSDPDLTERFYLAWRDADYVALGDLLAPDAQWIIAGQSRFAGTTKGRDAIIAMRQTMSELTGGTWSRYGTTLTTSSPANTTRSPSTASWPTARASNSTHTRRS